MGEVSEPVFIGPGIIIEVGDDLTRGGIQAYVAGAAQAAVLNIDQSHLKVPHDLRG